MKKIIIFLGLLICCSSFFSACGEAAEPYMAGAVSYAENEVLAEEPVECATEVSLIGFESLEDFLVAAEAAAAGGDIADLASLTEISLPTSLPDGYMLYKITAGALDIGFWYLPEEYLTDESTILEAEAYQKHIMFIDSRGSCDFETLVTQLGGHPSNLIKGKYFITYTSTYMINWEENGKLLSMYLPADMGIGNGTISTTEMESGTTVTYNDLDTFCETETITIRTDEQVE